MELSKRESQWRTGRFRRITNRQKRTEWWDANRPTGVSNSNYTDLITSTPNTFPYISSSYSYNSTVFETVLYSTFFNLSDPPLNIVNTIATNLPITFLKINIIQNQISPLTNLAQAQRATLHLKINNRTGKSIYELRQEHTIVGYIRFFNRRCCFMATVDKKPTPPLA